MATAKSRLPIQHLSVNQLTRRSFRAYFRHVSLSISWQVRTSWFSSFTSGRLEETRKKSPRSPFQAGYFWHHRIRRKNWLHQSWSVHPQQKSVFSHRGPGYYHQRSEIQTAKDRVTKLEVLPAKFISSSLGLAQTQWWLATNSSSIISKKTFSQRLHTRGMGHARVYISRWSHSDNQKAGTRLYTSQKRPSRCVSSHTCCQKWLVGAWMWVDGHILVWAFSSFWSQNVSFSFGLVRKGVELDNASKSSRRYTWLGRFLWNVRKLASGRWIQHSFWRDMPRPWFDCQSAGLRTLGMTETKVVGDQNDDDAENEDGGKKATWRKRGGTFQAWLPEWGCQCNAVRCGGAATGQSTFLLIFLPTLFSVRTISHCTFVASLLSNTGSGYYSSRLSGGS